MFQNSTNIGRTQQGFTNSVANELAITLEMPGWSKGKMVPTSRVVTALLWQQYGLDVLHPEVSRWLEQNAPDVKHAAAENRAANGSESNNAQFRVGSDGTVKVHLSLKVDDRLREVSSRYLLSQVRHSIEPKKEYRRAA
jgi:hypothetical protein